MVYNSDVHLLHNFTISGEAHVRLDFDHVSELNWSRWSEISGGAQLMRAKSEEDVDKVQLRDCESARRSEKEVDVLKKDQNIRLAVVCVPIIFNVEQCK